MIWDANFVRNKYRILALQSLESTEFADKLTTVQLTFYYFNTDGLHVNDEVVQYKDAGGSFYMESLPGGAAAGPSVVTPLVGETYSGHYQRAEDKANLNGRPYYVNWLKKAFLAWNSDKYSILKKSCLASI
jgi:hypothetical protein